MSGTEDTAASTSQPPAPAPAPTGAATATAAAATTQQTTSTAPNNFGPTGNATTGAKDDEQVGEDLPHATPRDVRLLHLIMASMGVTSYQDRVPLQLMDFAYRYTHGVLQDALLYNDHSHASASTLPAGVGAANAPITTDDVRLAVAARTNYQFKPAAPKELMLELAQERNKRPLPTVSQTYGLRLPPEKYCLTSKEWQLDDEPDQKMHEMVVEMPHTGKEKKESAEEEEDVEMGNN